jgi:MscS family membrane protein
MDRLVWGNTIESYLWTIGVVLFVLLLNRFISKYFARLVFKIFPKRLQVYDQQRFTNLVVNPLGTFLGHHGFYCCILQIKVSAGPAIQPL